MIEAESSCGSIITGHSALRTNVSKLGLTQRQNCRLCGDEKEAGVYTVCQCPALACKKYRTLGRKFLTPKDLENMTVQSLTSLVANTRLGIAL